MEFFFKIHEGPSFHEYVGMPEEPPAFLLNDVYEIWDDIEELWEYSLDHKHMIHVIQEIKTLVRRKKPLQEIIDTMKTTLIRRRNGILEWCGDDRFKDYLDEKTNNYKEKFPADEWEELSQNKNARKENLDTIEDYIKKLEDYQASVKETCI